MFCPQCRTEYRDGFTSCADCNVDLVAALAPEPPTEYVDFQPILETYNPADIAIIKSILDAEAITYYFQGDHLTLRPYGAPARLMVDAPQVETVRELLEELTLSYIEPSI